MNILSVVWCNISFYTQLNTRYMSAKLLKGTFSDWYSCNQIHFSFMFPTLLRINWNDTGLNRDVDWQAVQRLACLPPCMSQDGFQHHRNCCKSWVQLYICSTSHESNCSSRNLMGSVKVWVSFDVLNQFSSWTFKEKSWWMTNEIPYAEIIP